DPLIGGFSVSLPYKELIVDYLDDVDDDAMRIGAVNTVVNKNGALFGYNTDFIGATRALTGIRGGLKGKVVVILGAGGVARAIAYGLLAEGADVWIKNRTRPKADRIAVEFAEMFDSEIHSDDWDNWQTGDILINATSFWLENKDLGATELPDFCDESFVKDFETVMDVGYNSHMKNFPDPLMTPLLLVAKEVGCKVITGDKMLLYQAAEQFKLWTGKKAPMEVMSRALKKAL
ncbi:MAG: shikimate dehydrogenase, partial [Patescibacteria group bacterium]